MPSNIAVLMARGYLDTAPTAQLTIDADHALHGSEVDMAGYTSLSYTLTCITNGVTWTVQGANVSDYSDAVVAQAAAAVAVGAVGSYSTALAVFRYYRVLIKATVGSSQGTATVVAHQKV
jgi:hypothetical protein